MVSNVTWEVTRHVEALNFVSADTVSKFGVVQNIGGCFKGQVMHAEELAILCSDNIGLDEIRTYVNCSLKQSKEPQDVFKSCRTSNLIAPFAVYEFSSREQNSRIRFKFSVLQDWKLL